MPTVTIVGTTTWGTTLGIVLARQGVQVRLLARTEGEAAQLEAKRENARFVPGVRFPDALHASALPRQAFDDADVALFVVPSKTLRDNARRYAEYIGPSSVVVSATKGLEVGTSNRMSRVLEEELQADRQYGVCVLSGPNLAKEIVAGKPSSTGVASADKSAATRVQSIINSSVFRVYINDDIVGVELCGALKNIIALGAGISDGLDLGDNAKAAFLTRGLAEITRLGVAAGAIPATFAGLAGLGDLVATCSSAFSRNHYVGEQLALGRSLEEIRDTMHNVAEGVDTTRAALSLAERLGVEMPITRAIYDVLFGGVSGTDAVVRLMGRDPRSE